MQTRIPKFRFSEPRRNLPKHRGVATPEDHFTIGFARSYKKSASKTHRNCNTHLVLAREIPINGFGIADLYAVHFQPSDFLYSNLESFIKSEKPRTRAFECKLSDWRGGLSQAARYRFFAKQAILVCPPNICDRARVFLDTFKAVKVGLWSYDKSNCQITKFHTPRPMNAISSKYNNEALLKIHRATQKSLPIS